MLSGNWQVGSIWEEREGKGWGWALGVGVPVPEVRTHDGVESLEEAKRQFQETWAAWLTWADLQEGSEPPQRSEQCRNQRCCCHRRLPQSSSASRLTAGASGFLNLSQSFVRPDR